MVYGDYPEVMKKKIANRSKLQGFARSRLPSFTAEEKAMIKGTFDFVSVNSYASKYARAIPNPNMTAVDWEWDAEVYNYQPDALKVNIYINSPLLNVNLSSYFPWLFFLLQMLLSPSCCYLMYCNHLVISRHFIYRVL